jgi:predicted enzyme related to lactoylglutathione lyase
MLCWADLGTTDVAGARRFYSELLGWTLDDLPMEGSGTYVLGRLRGRSVAAFYELSPQGREQKVSPGWLSYFAVKDVDARAAQARKLGAKVVSEPFDLMDAGRRAVLQDPTGATFGLWEGTRHAGAGIMNEPGALTWTELQTTDEARALAFYSALLGWTAKPEQMAPEFKYTSFLAGGKATCGMMPMPRTMPRHVPSFWMVYFSVADSDATAAAAQRTGGKQHASPQDIPGVGRFAVLADPRGASFSILQSASR